MGIRTYLESGFMAWLEEQWKGASGTAQIDYRWGITQQLLDDIFKGLESSDA